MSSPERSQRRPDGLPTGPAIARRRQRPARLPLQAAAGQAADLDPDRGLDARRRDRRRRLRRPGDRRRRRARRPSCSALLIVFAIADSRAEDAFFEVYAAAARPRRSAAGRRCRRRRRCCARATTATPSAPSPAPLADGVDGTLALYTYEEETHRQRGQPPDQLLPLHRRPGRGPRVRRPRPRALLPAQVRAARAGEVRGRLPQLERAGQAGERGARRQATRSSPARSRTPSGCASSSPPPSSSG